MPRHGQLRRARVLRFWVVMVLAGAAVAGFPPRAAAEVVFSLLRTWGQYGVDPGKASAVAVDASGSVYLTDAANFCVSVYTSAGVFTSRFGSRGHGDGQLYSPCGIAVGDGVYVLDAENCCVQKFTTAGEYVTRWGGQYGNPGDFGLARGLTAGLELNPTVYVAHTSNHCLRKYHPNGTLNLTIGEGGTGDGKLASPRGVAVSGDSEVFVADTGNNRVQRFSKTGVYGLKWGGPGTGESEFDQPRAIAMGSSNDLFVADYGNNRIQRFDGLGLFRGHFGNSGGEGQLTHPYGVAVDAAADTVYVVDEDTSGVRCYRRDGTYTGTWDCVPGPGAFLYAPRGLAVAGDGTVYVASSNAHCVEAFTPTGSHVAKWGGQGNGDGELNTPRGLALGGAGHVYVADYGNSRLQEFSSSGEFIRKWGQFGTGPGELKYPEAVAVDATGNVYVADSGNNRVQKFSATGTPLAQFGSEGTGHGEFRGPCGVALDGTGAIYVADNNNNRVQKLSASGAYLAQWGSFGDGDGQFMGLKALAVDQRGLVYVADGNARVQVFTAEGALVGKLACSGEVGALAADRSGRLYTTDTSSDCVRILTTTCPPSAPTAVTVTPAAPVCTSPLQAQAGGAVDLDGDTVGYEYQWCQREGSTWGQWGHDSTDGLLGGVTLHSGERWKARARACSIAGPAPPRAGGWLGTRLAALGARVSGRGSGRSLAGRPLARRRPVGPASRDLPAAETSAWVESTPVVIVNSAPTAPTGVALAPSGPTPAEDLVATATGSTDADGTVVSYRYEWARKAPGAHTWDDWAYPGRTLSAEHTSKGEVWRARARATDGSASSAWKVSVAATIGNSPPVRPSTVTIAPAAPDTTSRLVATASGASDADGEALTYCYEWARKAAGAAAWGAWGDAGRSLSSALTTVGDNWKARARASDGAGYSNWRESAPVVIADLPPSAPTVVTITPAHPLTDDALTAAASGSSDPDGTVPVYRYQWARRPAGAAWEPWSRTSSSVPRGLTTKGDCWRVRACAGDGHLPSAWTGCPPVTIGDTPPTRPALVAIEAGPGSDQLTARVSGGSDADGDALSYQWQWRLWQTAPTPGWGPWRAPNVSPYSPVTAGHKWQLQGRTRSGSPALTSAWVVSAPVVVPAAFARAPLTAAPAAVHASAAVTAGGTVSLAITLSAAARVQVCVLNLAGQVVAVVPEQSLGVGTQAVLWNGRGRYGTLAPPGPYLLRVEARQAGGAVSRVVVPCLR